VTGRDALLEGAIECLQRKGYARTTARDIASASGAGLGTIGYHFGSKDRLLTAALTEAIRRWFEPLIAAVREQGSPLTAPRLAAGLDQILSSFEPNRPLVIAYFEALRQAEREPALRRRLAREYDRLRAAAREALAGSLSGSSSADAPDPEVAASLVMATFDGLIIQWLLDPDRLPSGELIAETVERSAHTLHGLLKPTT